MIISKDERNLLLLSKREIVIINALEQLKEASIQDIADHVEIPRTSLYWPLSQLLRRHLVAFKKVGKRKSWYSNMNQTLLRKNLGSISSIVGDVRVVESVEHMRELYMKALELHPAERVLILEGNKAVLSIAKHGGVEFMASWHAQAHKNNIIVESIIGESVYIKLIKNVMTPKVLQSLAMLDTWIAHRVPDTWLDVDSAVVLFRDVAILVLINSPEIVRLIRNFCEMYQHIGSKVDIVAEVRKVVDH
jgi:sulfur relay (sulfurtransferase) DsrC/TusE family protein